MRKPGTSLVLLAALCIPAAAGPTKIADAGPQGRTLSVAYSIAFWGIPFGRTNYDGRFNDAGYSARSHFETSGIVSVFWNAIIDATATGRMAPHQLIPNEYDSYYRRSETKTERVKVTFANGDAAVFADPPYNATQWPVTAEQKREAVDPMSAVTLILAGVKADAANPCGTVAPVFDGRRRYDITFTYVKDEDVKLPNNVYSGRAHLCQLHYDQIAGFKPKILKEGKAFPPMYADFADVPAAGGGHYVVALKLWAAVSMGIISGTVTADLTQLHVGTEATKS
jgi:hypothetical protein